MNKRKKPQDETKHEAILKAATKLFLKHGYTYTSMENIADEARVTKQTVYAHFQSKDALFTSMVSDLCIKHAPSESILKDKGQPVEVQLKEIGRAFLGMLTSKEGLEATRLVISEVHSHPELAERYYNDCTQRMVAMLGEFLDEKRASGELDIENSYSAAANFFSLLKGRYYVRMLLAIKPMPAAAEKEEHVLETVRAFMKIYAPR